MKKTLFLILSIVMVLALLPMAAAAEDSGEITTWAGLQAAVAESGTVKLTQDIVCDDQDLGPIVIPSGADVTIDLNGHVIDRGLTKATNFGNVITVEGTLTIEDSSPDAVHVFRSTYPWTLQPDDSHAGEDGYETASGGIITGGYCKYANFTYLYYAGGVQVNGTLTMNGGSICGNVCNGIGGGGGIRVNGGVLTLNTGSAVIGNLSHKSAGGIYAENGAKVFVSGGAIERNVCTDSGGGAALLSNSTLTLSDGRICGNSSLVSGGGISVSGESEAKKALFVMTGGEISGNSVSNGPGGGVNVDNDNEFRMSGGTITDNTSRNSDEYTGGGVYVNVRGKCFLSGSSVISGNRNTWERRPEDLDANVTLNATVFGAAVIEVPEALSADARIGVSIKASGNSDTDLVAARGEVSDGSAFFSDDKGYFTRQVDDTVILGYETYELWVCGVQVTSKNRNDLAAAIRSSGSFADGTITYDPDSSTLTLENAHIYGGSDNTNNYGYGIRYQGEKALTLSVSGENVVCDNAVRYYRSYGIVFGDPDPRVMSTLSADLNILLSDGASLSVSCGSVSASEDFIGSCGITGVASLTVSGAGSLTVSAAENAKRSLGIVAQTVTVDGSCSVSAAAGNAGDGTSVGIYCVNFTLPETFTGSVTARSGDAPGTYYNTATYGIRTTGDVSIGGGSVTAISGRRTAENTSADYAAGIFGENSLVISGGAEVYAKGDGFGLFCYQRTASIDASSVITIGDNRAANDLILTHVTAEGSARTDGGDLEPYDESAARSYKYIKTTPNTALRGDMDGDGLITTDDAIYLLRHALSPDRYPIEQSGDMDGDGIVTTDDAIYLLRHALSPERYPLH